jgi:hypothetical protein
MSESISHQYIALKCQGVGHKSQKKKTNGTNHHDDVQQQTDKGHTDGHVEQTLAAQIGGLCFTITELKKYKIVIAAIKKQDEINRPNKVFE